MVIRDIPLPTSLFLYPPSSIAISLIFFLQPVLEWCDQFRLRLCGGAFAKRVALSLEDLPYP